MSPRSVLRLGLLALAIATLAIIWTREDGTASPSLNARGLGIAEVQGRPVLVEVFVALRSGANPEAELHAALWERGARPLRPHEYTATGMVWDQFSDSAGDNNFVAQWYNPSGDPTGGGLNALQNTHNTWNAVASSSFAFSYEGTTTRCPSLVNECPGAQVFDGLNDVAWLDLGGCSIFRCTLGVTWFSDSGADEADMALNTRVSWRTNGSDYDVETVLLHENGHAAGLGHSENIQAIMYAYYQGVRRTLHSDDISGISALYPTDADPPATSTPTPTPTPTSPTPTPTPTATPTASPSPGQISLSASPYKVKGVKHADLAWSGATSINVDMFRNGSKVVTTANDGAYTDNAGTKGGGSTRYKVCEAGTTTCSVEVTVSY